MSALVVIESLKALLFGIVEGITEWLPISSTGHLILLEEFVPLKLFTDVKQNEAFFEMFKVVIQLGAILAVVVVFFKKIWPFSKKGEVLGIINRRKLNMWLKIIVACLPAAVVGLFFDKYLEALFQNFLTVGIMLILVGVAFIVVEKLYAGKAAKAETVDDITWGKALGIGCFQLLAAIFPGTSRSGATILGGRILGVGRTAAAEFTFFLGIPVMFGASLLKLVKFGFDFTAAEAIILAVGMISAFVVSLICIRFLMDYIKKHDFKVFGYYRIVLGVLVIGYYIFKCFVK